MKDGKKGVQVFHCGSHCCPITSRPEKTNRTSEGNDKETSSLKTSRNKSAFVKSSLRTGEDWDKMEKEATQLLDRKWIVNQKQSVRQEIHPNGKNFEAVVTFKQY